MHRRALLLRHVTLTLIALLAAQVTCASAWPRPSIAAAAATASPALRFGQTLALADFDGDDRIDKAALSGYGRSKSLEVRLSRLNTRALLRFDTRTSERGSIFASDVDHDGDNDLIWTDLLHPDDVVVWLDDGSGRFERVCPDAYAEDFVLTEAPALGHSEIPHQDVALGSQRDPSSLPLAPRQADAISTELFAGVWLNAAAAAGCQRTLCNRGPPSLLV